MTQEICDGKVGKMSSWEYKSNMVWIGMLISLLYVGCGVAPEDYLSSSEMRNQGSSDSQEQQSDVSSSENVPLSNNEPSSEGDFSHSSSEKYLLSSMAVPVELISSDASDTVSSSSSRHRDESSSVMLPLLECDGIMVPAKIEAESYDDMFGVELGESQDDGGGESVGYIDVDDWLKYSVGVEKSGEYIFKIRTSSESSGGTVVLSLSDVALGTITIPPTLGWQNWVTVPLDVFLERGCSVLTIRVISPGFDLNYIEIVEDEESVLSALELKHEVPRVRVGESVELKIVAYDQHTRKLPLTGEWSVTSGIITQEGVYTPGVDETEDKVQYHMDGMVLEQKIVIEEARPAYHKTATFYDDFNFFNDVVWEKTEELVKNNDGVFNVSWVKDNAFVRDGNFVLALSPPEDEGGLYRGGEIRLIDNLNPVTAKGYYETRAKVIAVNGVVSSFFTLHDAPDRCPWSEVDFEWLAEGSKTHTNYIYSEHEGICVQQHDRNGGHWQNPGGFDVNDDFHTYGFDVQDDVIIWYVDNVEVDKYYRWDGMLYTMPTKIMINVWTTYKTPWTGDAVYTGGYREAQYDYIGYWEGGKPY